MLSGGDAVVVPGEIPEGPPKADGALSRQGARRQTLSRSERLRSKGDFNRVFAFGRSAADRRLVVYTRENGLPHSRLGLSVGRRIGGAVQRNRVKRILREAFRLSRDTIPPGLDVFIVVRPPEKKGADHEAITQLGLDRLRQELSQLVARSVAASPRSRPLDKNGRRGRKRRSGAGRASGGGPKT